MVTNRKELKRGFRLIWHTTIWAIWNVRNNIIFNNVALDVDEVVEDIKLLSWKWSVARLRIQPCLLYEWRWDPKWCLGALWGRLVLCAGLAGGVAFWVSGAGSTCIILQVFFCFDGAAVCSCRLGVAREQFLLLLLFYCEFRGWFVCLTDGLVVFSSMTFFLVY